MSESTETVPSGTAIIMVNVLLTILICIATGGTAYLIGSMKDMQTSVSGINDKMGVIFSTTQVNLTRVVNVERRVDVLEDKISQRR